MIRAVVWWTRQEAWFHCVVLALLLFVAEPMLRHMTIATARLGGGLVSLAFASLAVQLVVLLLCVASVFGLVRRIVSMFRIPRSKE